MENKAAEGVDALAEKDEGNVAWVSCRVNDSASVRRLKLLRRVFRYGRGVQYLLTVQ